MADGSPWPRISIVTPSFRQAEFIEETLRSVLLQGYPNLQYMVIDGGSTDGTTAILERYDPWLSYWVSEKDRGQSEAINKGFARADGEILAWLNSDDLLMPGALAEVARRWLQQRGRLIAGPVIWFEHHSGAETLRHQRGLTFAEMVQHWTKRCEFHQPGVFFPRELAMSLGGVDESLRYAMDYDLFCRLLRHTDAEIVEQPLARFRYHAGSKTGGEGDLFLVERHQCSQRYWADLGGVDEAAASRFVARALTRFATRRAARGDWPRARLLGRRALALSPLAVLAEPWAMSFGFIASRMRRAMGRRTALAR
jgi:glycosyltransferase involved in cell wall biosynthesis